MAPSEVSGEPVWSPAKSLFFNRHRIYGTFEVTGNNTAMHAVMVHARKSLPSAPTRKKRTSTAAIYVMPQRTAEPPQECFDTQELASQAADALEAYSRAPWRRLTDQARMAKLGRAISLLHRIEDLETGRIPMPIWGD